MPALPVHSPCPQRPETVPSTLPAANTHGFSACTRVPSVRPLPPCAIDILCAYAFQACCKSASEGHVRARVFSHRSWPRGPSSPLSCPSVCQEAGLEVREPRIRTKSPRDQGLLHVVCAVSSFEQRILHTYQQHSTWFRTEELYTIAVHIHVPWGNTTLITGGPGGHVVSQTLRRDMARWQVVRTTLGKRVSRERASAQAEEMPVVAPCCTPRCTFAFAIPPPLLTRAQKLRCV